MIYVSASASTLCDPIQGCSHHYYTGHSTPVRPTCPAPTPDSFPVLSVVDATYEHGDVFTIIEEANATPCKIYASLFLSSSGPHAMVPEAFLTTKDILIVRRFCARQVEIYN